MLGSRPRTTEN